MTMEIELKIDLEDFLSLDDLEDNVIRQLAATCESKLAGGHAESFYKLCMDVIDEAISGRIKDRVEDLLSRPIPAVDRFGEPTGETPKTLNQMVLDGVDAALIELVDNQGKPALPSKHTPREPRLQWAIRQAASADLDREVARVIREVKDEAIGAARDRVARAIALQLEK